MSSWKTSLSLSVGRRDLAFIDVEKARDVHRCGGKAMIMVLLMCAELLVPLRHVNEIARRIDRPVHNAWQV